MKPCVCGGSNNNCRYCSGSGYVADGAGIPHKQSNRQSLDRHPKSLGVSRKILPFVPSKSRSPLVMNFGGFACTDSSFSSPRLVMEMLRRSCQVSRNGVIGDWPFTEILSRSVVRGRRASIRGCRRRKVRGRWSPRSPWRRRKHQGCRRRRVRGQSSLRSPWHHRKA